MRRLAGILAAAVAAIVITPGTASARPYNPSDGEISAAQRAANDAATQVGQISAELAQAQTEVGQAEGQANIALDRYEGQQQQYETAQGQAAAAAAAEQKAQAEEDQARTVLASFARDSYISGSTSSRLTGLITSGSPGQMLERAALLDAAGDRRSAVLDRMTAAEREAATASAAAQAALSRADALKRQAAAALAAAEQQEAVARQKAASFQAQQTQLQGQLQQAQQTLGNLQGQRAAAIAYDQQQTTASSRGRWSLVAYTSAGPGSAAAVQTAIHAAERWIGQRYAWGGGSLTGPSEGFGIDAGVVGFDCSGLTRYAYAQAGIVIPRQSSAQYAALPKVAPSDLQPGDLVFYAFDTRNPSTIHHVAMYLGGGRMIEAPESGERVHETAMRWGGYIGAVRPSA